MRRTRPLVDGLPDPSELERDRPNSRRGHAQTRKPKVIRKRRKAQRCTGTQYRSRAGWKRSMGQGCRKFWEQRGRRRGGAGGSGKRIAGSPERNESAEDSDRKEIEATIEVSLSESNEAAGNLLRFNPPIITKRRSQVRLPTNPTAYTLWDCGLGGSDKFVHPELISRLRTAGYAIKTRKRGQMNLRAPRTPATPRSEARPRHRRPAILRMVRHI